MSEKKTNQYFVKKNMDRLSSPEQLDDYIKVSNPGIWLVLLAIIILLSGVFFWMVNGKMDSEVSSVAICNNGIVTCYINETDGQTVKKGMKLTINDTDTTISSITDEPEELPANSDSYLMHLGGLDSSSFVYSAKASVSAKMPDGIYPVSIVTDTVSPITFILN